MSITLNTYGEKEYIINEYFFKQKYSANNSLAWYQVDTHCLFGLLFVFNYVLYPHHRLN